MQQKKILKKVLSGLWAEGWLLEGRWSAGRDQQRNQRGRHLESGLDLANMLSVGEICHDKCIIFQC